jgi:hypothetical protein
MRETTGLIELLRAAAALWDEVRAEESLEHSLSWTM